MGGLTDARLREQMIDALPQGLIAHTDRVVALSDQLARRHGLNVERTRLMAQGHDLLRHIPGEELLRRAEERGLAIDPVERDEPLLLHGPVGAAELAERFGIDDDEVLFAIHWHTTGHTAYTAEAWAMFIADKVDPHKVERWPPLAEVRSGADRSLQEGALRYLDLRLEDAVREGYSVHPMAILARNTLLRALKE